MSGFRNIANAAELQKAREKAEAERSAPKPAEAPLPSPAPPERASKMGRPKKDRDATAGYTVYLTRKLRLDVSRHLEKERDAMQWDRPRDFSEYIASLIERDIAGKS